MPESGHWKRGGENGKLPLKIEKKERGWNQHRILPPIDEDSHIQEITYKQVTHTLRTWSTRRSSKDVRSSSPVLQFGAVTRKWCAVAHWCATSWYWVCREFLLETLFKY
jgi:hypothetical protein